MSEWNIVDKEKVERARRQRVADLLVDCAMTIHTNREHFDGMGCNEVGEWMCEQLNKCGVPCGPIGSCHVYLNKGSE